MWTTVTRAHIYPIAGLEVTVHKENRHYVSEMRQTEPGLEFLQFKISFFHSKGGILKSHTYDNHKMFN